jgi:hypothetical protein
MNTKRANLAILGGMLLAGLATILVIQRQTLGRLAQDNAALRPQAEQARQVAAENERLSNLVASAQAATADATAARSELLRLRGEVGLLRRQVKEREARREQNRQVAAGPANSSAADSSNEPASADYWPKDSWRFQGYGTPEAAMQSQFYAASQGDVTNFLASTTGKMKAMVEADLGGKSEAEVAEKFHKEMDELQSVRVLDRTNISEGVAGLSIFFQGTTQKSESMLILNRIGNEWKLADIHKW